MERALCGAPESILHIPSSPRLGGELLPQANEFKYLWVLFMGDGKMEQEMDRRSGTADAALDHHSEEGAEPEDL